MSQTSPPQEYTDYTGPAVTPVPAVAGPDERIYAAAAEFAETLSFSRLREFLSEATRWRSLLMLRH